MEKTQEMPDYEATFDLEVYEIVAATAEVHWTSVAVNETFSILTIDLPYVKRADNQTFYYATALYQLGDTKKLEELRKEILPLSIYRLKVRDNGNWFLLVDIVDKDVEDQEIEERLSLRERINTFQDQTFGELVLTRTNDAYETKIDWMGRSVNFYLDWQDRDRNLSEIEDLLETAYQIYANRQSWDEHIRKFVAQHLQHRGYDDWPVKKEESEAEKQQTVKVFMKYLLPETILIYEGGKFVIWFQSNWLTGSLTIKANLKDGLLKIDIDKDDDDMVLD